MSDCSPETLRAVAAYASRLAEHRERTARRGDSDRAEDDDTPATDRPDDVPTKATITVKTINDNRYYYWQWREGDQVKSKYKGPVDADE